MAPPPYEVYLITLGIVLAFYGMLNAARLRYRDDIIFLACYFQILIGVLMAVYGVWSISNG